MRCVIHSLVMTLDSPDGSRTMSVIAISLLVNLPIGQEQQLELNLGDFAFHIFTAGTQINARGVDVSVA